MDKQTFCYILEASLLAFDGVTEEDMNIQYGIKKEIAKIGIDLCNYLKCKEIK